jgi:hypothetical protein
VIARNLRVAERSRNGLALYDRDHRRTRWRTLIKGGHARAKISERGEETMKVRLGRYQRKLFYLPLLRVSLGIHARAFSLRFSAVIKLVAQIRGELVEIPEEEGG